MVDACSSQVHDSGQFISQPLLDPRASPDMTLSLATLLEPLNSYACMYTCTHSHHPMSHTLEPLDPHKHLHVHVCKHTRTSILTPVASDSVSNTHAHSHPYSPHVHSPHRPSHMNSPAPTLSHSNTSVGAHSLLRNPWEGTSLKLQLKLSLFLQILSILPFRRVRFTVFQVSPCAVKPGSFCEQSHLRDTLALCSLNCENKGPCLHPPHSQCLRAADLGGSRLQGLSKPSQQKRSLVLYGPPNSGPAWPWDCRHGSPACSLEHGVLFLS